MFEHFPTLKNGVRVLFLVYERIAKKGKHFRLLFYSTTNSILRHVGQPTSLFIDEIENYNDRYVSANNVKVYQQMY